MKSLQTQFARVLILGLLMSLPACRPTPQTPEQSPPTQAPAPSVVSLLHAEDFSGDMSNWFVERENGGEVSAKNGILDIDVPAGCTVWFRTKLSGSVAIEYEARAIQAGGPNDRVSDLNCFWMASNRERSPDLFAHPRSGKFDDYNTLRTYYASVGGNGNTTTRFRRYIGDAVQRPLLPEHDLGDAKVMLRPNVLQKIRLAADGKLIQFFRDGKELFRLDDPEPYMQGWFGFRTTKSHLQIGKFRVYQLEH